MNQKQIEDVVRLVRRFLPPRFDHEVIAIDILMECWTNHIDRPTWRFVYRRCVDARRAESSNQRATARFAMLPFTSPRFEDVVQREEQVDRLVGPLSTLERQIIWYRFYQDMSLADISKEIKRDVNTIRQVLATALDKMKQAAMSHKENQ